MKTRLLAALMSFSAPGLLYAQRAPVAPAPVGDKVVALQFQGGMRHYLLHSGAPTGPRALVLVFHGGGQTAEQMRQLSDFDVIADRERFIVVFAEGIEHSWSDGRNATPAEQQGVDDVGFAKAIVADVSRTHALDRSRIFATGFSNGGMLAYRLACEAAETFIAIAPVAATIPASLARSCHPAAPVAVLSILGREDPAVRFNGTPVGDRPGAALLGSRETESLWHSLNGCTSTADISPLGAHVQDGTTIEARAHMNCRGMPASCGTKSRRGHRWPPLQEAVNAAQVREQYGVWSRNINTSEVIWKFFARTSR